MISGQTEKYRKTQIDSLSAAVTFCHPRRVGTVLCTLLLVVLFFASTGSSHASKPPAALMDAIDNLAMVSASLMNCFKSAEYKRLSRQRAYQLDSTLTSIENTVSKVERHYGGDLLMPTYYLAVSEYVASNSIKRQTLERFNNLCATTLLDSVQNYAVQSDRLINRYLNR